MNYRNRTCAYIFIVSLALVASSSLVAAGALADALAETDVAVALRYRFEAVDRDIPGEKDAEASTLRSAIKLTTGTFRGARVVAEVENVTVVGDERYNSLRNGMTDRAVVADPAVTQFNEAYLEFGSGDTKARLGRQEIVLSDARFVGNVGWRQNHQSFDSLRIDHKFSDSASLTYAYIDSVLRIFGDSRDMAGHAIEAKLKSSPGTFRLYGLSLDWDAANMAGLSTQTFGVEFAGAHEFSGWKALYELEFANQTDTGDNPGSVDADYTHAMFGGACEWATTKIGREELEGTTAGGKFTTPLATLHKFNGWADIFLATPAAGLVDTYVQFNGKQGRMGWLAAYHTFEASTGSFDYGDEIDAQVTYKTSANLTIALKAALYSADGFAVDVDKWMLWSAYAF